MTTTEIRIEGCLKNIEKTKKTLERHQERLAKKIRDCEKIGIYDPETYVVSTTTPNQQYWAMSEYSDAKDAIKNTQKKLKELTEKLESYKIKKAEEDKKADVPMIPAVEEFLENWRASADAYYREQVKKIKEWTASYREFYEKQMKELEDKYGYAVHCYNPRKDNELRTEMKARKVNSDYKQDYLKKNFTQDCLRLAIYRDDEFETQLNKELDREVAYKRIDLYHRCSAVVGVITDATGLKIGNNGSINGEVIGEEGKAHVETITAGGYNIQILHYRVLVRPV